MKQRTWGYGCLLNTSPGTSICAHKLLIILFLKSTFVTVFFCPKWQTRKIKYIKKQESLLIHMGIIVWFYCLFFLKDRVFFCSVDYVCFHKYWFCKIFPCILCCSSLPFVLPGTAPIKRRLKPSWSWHNSEEQTCAPYDTRWPWSKANCSRISFCSL